MTEIRKGDAALIILTGILGGIEDEVEDQYYKKVLQRWYIEFSDKLKPIANNLKINLL
jgi:hypothetical protein